MRVQWFICERAVFNSPDRSVQSIDAILSIHFHSLLCLRRLYLCMYLFMCMCVSAFSCVLHLLRGLNNFQPLLIIFFFIGNDFPYFVCCGFYWFHYFHASFSLFVFVYCGRDGGRRGRGSWGWQTLLLLLFSSPCFSSTFSCFSFHSACSLPPFSPRIRETFPFKSTFIYVVSIVHS